MQQEMFFSRAGRSGTVAITVLLCALISTGPASAQTARAEIDSQTWLNHVAHDMLPFWSGPEALGSPIGNFPTDRCNDGSLPSTSDPCEVGTFRTNNPRQSVVALSRQMYSYGVAFHMTGNTDYLDYALDGLEYQFGNAIDPDTGLFYRQKDVTSGDWTAGGIANAQEQAYGLLGPAFLYYLTRDPDLYAQIKTLNSAIKANLRLPKTGAFRHDVGDGEASAKLVDHLDQLNAYQYLMSVTAPEADRAGWQADSAQTAAYIRDSFYDPSSNLFQLDAAAAPGAVGGVDFGHTAKSFWFTDLIGTATGDAEAVAFAREGAGRLFEQAFLEGSGSWANGFDKSGELDPQPFWWIYTELDQYAASLALDDPTLRPLVAEAQGFWLDNFVDNDNGGIWARVAEDGTAFEDARKHWKWKAGFHAFEHALVSYVATGAIDDTDTTLYFARDEGDTDFSLAYSFSMEPRSVEQLDSSTLQSMQKVTLAGVSMDGVAANTVPVPAAGFLLIGGLAIFGAAGAVSRRRKSGAAGD